MRENRNNGRCRLVPTSNQTFEIAGEGECNFASVLSRSYELQGQGRFEEACNLRFQAFQRLAAVIPDDGETLLEWGHRNTQAALELLRATAVDHFLAGDTEMAEAMLELLLDLDPEDHTGSVALLGFCYVASGEYELFDEISMDIADTQAEKHILRLWRRFRESGELEPESLRTLRERFGAYYDEFRRADHPTDAGFVSDLESERPSRAALARELWLRTEHLWAREPQFIEALKTES